MFNVIRDNERPELKVSARNSEKKSENHSYRRDFRTTCRARIHQFNESSVQLETILSSISVEQHMKSWTVNQFNNILSPMKHPSHCLTRTVKHGGGTVMV